MPDSKAISDLELARILRTIPVSQSNNGFIVEAARRLQYGNTLTIDQAGWLSRLMRGVERGLKIKYYPYGSDDSDATMHVTELVLRAFSHDGGGLWFDRDGDIRDSFVWCSGFTERWLKVSDLLCALENAVTAKYGEDKPMAIIEEG